MLAQDLVLPEPRTIALWLDYDGTDYRGFGVQPHGATVQGVLESALAATLEQAVRVTAAARTDAGVHARGQVVSFRAATRLALDALQRGCNARLPRDVVVTAAREMAPDFDARRHALRRSYRYAVWNDPLRDVWQQRYAHHVRQPLDVAEMQRAADLLVGEHDFRAFAAELGPRAPQLRTTRTVSRAACSRDGSRVVFDLTATAFLRHMVRGIVGTLLQVGRHTIGVPDFGAILRGRDRRRAGPNAPAAGLTLVGIDYA